MIQTMTFQLTDPDNTAALSTTVFYWTALMSMTIVGLSVAPLEDDAGATLDLNGGSAAIAAVDASDADAPGTWVSTHMGGTQTPVTVADGDDLNFDLNSAAAANAFNVVIYYLPGIAS